MTEASDTVMTPEHLSLICGCPVDMICSAGDYEWKIAKAQAERSFRIGFEEGREEGKKEIIRGQEVLRTSEEWQKLLGVEVLDPDGWDRQNLEYSFYQEQITRKEFEKRLDTSTTCRM